MAGKIPVAGEQWLSQIETFFSRVSELTRQVRQHPVRLSAINRGLQDLIDGRMPSVETLTEDPLQPFRRIKGLVVIGPREWAKAMRSRDRRNRNPLNLAPDWCPQIPVPYTVEQMKKLVELCQTSEWTTTPVLWLALPEVAGEATSLANQYGWWGVPHDNLGPGKIRQDIFWSNWFIQPQHSWALEPAVITPRWLISYELPHWSTNLNWTNQQQEAARRSMTIATACRDALMCNLVAIVYGKKFRTSTYSRTVTLYDGNPLNVHWNEGYGLYVYQHFPPDFAYDNVSASIEGVPVELGL